MHKSVGQTLRSYALVAALAAVMGLNYELFVFPNSFAPAGINGIATMVQYLFHLNIGYFSLIVNAPLLVLAWCAVGREFACKNAVFILTFSAARAAASGPMDSVAALSSSVVVGVWIARVPLHTRTNSPLVN